MAESDSQTKHVRVPMTKEDLDLLQDLLDGSPFTQDALCQIAIRVGMKTIQKNPNVVMQFLAKKQG